MPPILSKLSGYRTYLAALGLLGLALYQFSAGEYETGFQTILAAAAAAGLRSAIAKPPASGPTAIGVMLLIALAFAQPAEAGHRRARAYRPAYTLAQPAAQVAPSTADPGSFLVWLNSIRARSGLGAVAWDAGLAAQAAVNSSRGFGHSFMGSARRQNAGMGPLPAVESMWLSSPPHASALLDPSITRVGLAGVGPAWTFNAY